MCQDIVRCENDKVLSVPGIKTLDEAMNVMNGMIVKKVRDAVDDARDLIRRDIEKRMSQNDSGSPLVDSISAPVLGTQKTN